MLAGPEQPTLSTARCPVCGAPIERPPRLCPSCDTPHHPECWEYAGGCAIFGCDPQRRRLTTGRLDPKLMQDALGSFLSSERAAWYADYLLRSTLAVVVSFGIVHFLLAFRDTFQHGFIPVPRAIEVGAWTSFALLLLLGPMSWAFNIRLARARTRLEHVLASKLPKLAGAPQTIMDQLRAQYRTNFLVVFGSFVCLACFAPIFLYLLTSDEAFGLGALPYSALGVGVYLFGHRAAERRLMASQSLVCRIEATLMAAKGETTKPV
jgi:hypothetical protein